MKKLFITNSVRGIISRAETELAQDEKVSTYIELDGLKSRFKIDLCARLDRGECVRLITLDEVPYFTHSYEGENIIPVHLIEVYDNKRFDVKKFTYGIISQEELFKMWETLAHPEKKPITVGELVS